MSVVNIIRHRDAVHILTDGASYDRQGEMFVATPKSWALPHVQAVLAFRGPMIFPVLTVENIGHAGSTYDEIKAGIVDYLRGVYDAAAAQLHNWPSGDQFEVFVAGISEITGPDSYVVVNHSRYPDVKPWTVTQLGQFSPSIGDPEVMERLWSKVPNASCADDLDPVRDGLWLMECQRAARFQCEPDQVEAGIVGGFAQLTTVTRDAITTRVIHKWPDKPGDRLVA